MFPRVGRKGGEGEHGRERSPPAALFAPRQALAVQGMVTPLGSRDMA